MDDKFFKDIKLNIKEINIKNLVPGTLIYKGSSIEPFSIECIKYDKKHTSKQLYTSSNDFLKDHTIEEEAGSVRWISVTGINHVDEIKVFSSAFEISNLIMEQVLYISNHSVNQYSEEFIFNDVQKVYRNNENHIINENISLFKRGSTIITFQERKDSVFQEVRERIRSKEGKIRNQSTNYLYYCLIDAMIDFYLDGLTVIGKEIELLEEKVVNIENVDVKNIHSIKKQLMVVKFSATPIEKMINKFIEDPKILPLDNEQYLLTLHGHIREVINELGLQKDYVDALFENYVLNNSNEMNSVMTTLTVFSAIFIPLSFVAGVFGMNFASVPGIDNPFAFVYFLAGCGLTAGFMLLLFKIKKWF